MRLPIKWTLAIFLAPLVLLIWLWTLGAGYTMAGGARSALGGWVVAGYAVATAVVLLAARRYAIVWLLGTTGIGLVWFFTLQASNDREWEVGVARTPSATFDGDRVIVRNVRHFRYRSESDFDVGYDERTLDLGKLDTVDLFLCYWDGNTAIAHTMLSFGFEGNEYICVSAETRREKGEAWGGLPGIYKQFEIIYILGDERDLIQLRTTFRKEEVYLYPLKVPQSEIRQYFEHMLRRINELNDEPEFYDTLDYNCSSSLTRMSAELWPDRSRPGGLSSLLNGATDQEAYARGKISNDLPFDELRRRSKITEIGQRYLDAPDFSQKIRAEVKAWQDEAPRAGTAR